MSLLRLGPQGFLIAQAWSVSALADPGETWIQEIYYPVLPVLEEDCSAIEIDEDHATPSRTTASDTTAAISNNAGATSTTTTNDTTTGTISEDVGGDGTIPELTLDPPGCVDVWVDKLVEVVCTNHFCACPRNTCIGGPSDWICFSEEPSALPFFDRNDHRIHALDEFTCDGTLDGPDVDDPSPTIPDP